MPAIGSHSTATSNAPWDGPANEARCPAEAGPLTASHAWRDPSGDPSVKTTYRYIHHFIGGNGQVGAASTVACSAGIAVLNGGRGGTTIPAADKIGVHAHLAKHLRDAGREPPPLRTQPDDKLTEARMPPVPMLAQLIERQFALQPVEMRAVPEGKRHIFGYAAVYDTISRPLGGFQETIARGAFNKSRGDGWPGVICRFNHNSDMLLGTTEARTLILHSDDHGLEYEVDPPKNLPLVREWVERGDVRRSSFAFRTIQDDWSTTDGGYPLRMLTEVQLVDVAPVVDPAYTATTAGVRGFIPEQDMKHAAVSAGYESLAVRVGASVEEVRSAATEDDLGRFFRRSDQPTPAKKVKPVFGPAAKAMLALREREAS